MAQPRKSFRTKKGTELPLLNLRGKEYLQIMHRLVWFREECPNASIRTQLINAGGEGKDTFYIFRAEIFVDTEKGMSLVATGHKRETVGDFPDAMEKAEMGAIGRALGVLGYGTQFAADDLDEGMRLADSPAPVIEEVVVSASTSNDAVDLPATASATGTEAAEPTTKRSSFRKRMSVASETADI